jgi:dephospho-CoA kinase
MKSRLLIGLTGGIASGKTFLARKLMEAGYPVYFADTVAKEMMSTNAELKQKLISLLGPQCYFPDGRLNRKWIATAIFSNPQLLAKVNEWVHEAVWHHFQEWVRHQNVPLLFLEAAILLETGWAQRLDRLIYVYAPIRLRYQRFLQREADGKAFWSRLQHQMNPHLAFSQADFIFFNDEIHFFEDQFHQLLQYLWSEERKLSS